MKSARATAGFTLLELLLALSLTAMLLALLTAGFHGVLRDWLQEDSVLDQAVERSLSLLQIERALEGAWPHRYRREAAATGTVATGTAGEPGLFFEGSAESLAWVSTLGTGPDKGLTAWQIESGEGGGLRLRRAPAGADNPTARLAAAAAGTLLFADHLLSLQYLAPAGPGTEAQWLPSWRGPERRSLPLAVHLRLSPRSESAAQAYEILIPIAANAHPALIPSVGP